MTAEYEDVGEKEKNDQLCFSLGLARSGLYRRRG